jgi:hypothetical protein
MSRRSVRALGAVAVLAVVGVAGGYGVGALQTEAPATISVAAPVPAQSPSYPTVEYDVLPDPDVAPLAVALPLREVEIRLGSRSLSVSVPRGWVRGGQAEDSWIYTPPAYVSNTYRLRIDFLDPQTSLGVERLNRINELRDAEGNGKLEHLVIEDETDTAFTATYLQGGYERVSIERFLDVGTGSSYATVAAVGRERDREGMADLVERVSASLAVPS